MSSKKSFDDWVQHVGESALPADEFTFTEGSNYGLDGFGFDKRMNEGVLDGARLPSVKGLSGLPDGFVAPPAASDLPNDDLTSERHAFNLSTMLSEEEGALHLSPEVKAAAQVVDLSWLDPTQKQDPRRLPKGLRPEIENANASIKELEEAWGAGKQTTGLELVPNTNEQEATQYKREVALGPKSGQPGAKKASTEDIRDVVLHAMRRSAFGHSLPEIKTEVALLLGQDAVRAKKAMELIESEHGLAGKVFIRASAFPGIKNGRWVKEIRKAARTARYVITDDPAVADKLKMTAVSEVPWKQALAKYRPALQSAGYKLASQGSPQDILKAAFADGPEAAPSPEGFKPIDVKPADRVTAAEAKEGFYATPVEEREVVDPSANRKASERREALVQIARWVKAGLLEQEDALKLQASKASAEMILKTGARLVAASGRPVPYQGTGTFQFAVPKAASVTRDEAWAALRTAEDKATKQAQDIESHRLHKFKVHVARMVRGGLLTKKEARHLVGLDQPVDTLYRLASKVASRRDRSEGEVVRVQKAASYKGPVFKGASSRRAQETTLSEEERQILAAAEEAGEKAQNITKVLRFARQQMTEGMAGHHLDAMLEAKFAKPLRKASSSLLRVLRDEHEGLAGHLYVDAEAYMSKTGTAGCEEGALKHRTNGIKYVLAADRCSGCIHVSAGNCKVYKKALAVEIPTKDPKAYQRKMLAATKATDAEVTASYFDQSEYDLGSPLDDFDLDGVASTETLGEILFGEMEV
jgi:hypothetical protein